MSKTNISIIAGSAFTFLNQLIHLANYIFSLSIHKIYQALKPPKEPPSNDLKTLVHEYYHNFLPLFDKILADKLLLHCPYDCNIHLKEGFTPLFGSLYFLTHNELTTLQE